MIDRPSYNTLEIHDSILEDGYSPAQFVPESLEIKYGYHDKRYSFHDEKAYERGRRLHRGVERFLYRF